MKRLLMLAILLAACSKKADPAGAAGAGSASAAVGFGPQQSEREAWKLICNIPNLAVSAIADVTIRQAEINKWFKANITNAAAAQSYLEISTVLPPDRKKYIHETAKKAGVDRCPLAVFYNPDPVSVPVPK